MTEVTISGEAQAALSNSIRQWSGWPDATLRFGVPDVSPFAQCTHSTRTFIANPEPLILNPHRVLLTVTPFRLRQEAVLTGCLLHEAAHARYSYWQPRCEEDLLNLKHEDGKAVSIQTLRLAKLLEEPRIEGIMASEADKHGARGLAWTMRASAAKLLPPTDLSAGNPGQQIMDIITSWVLRAGRQISLHEWTDYEMPSWVGDFTALLHTSLIAYFEGKGAAGAHSLALKVVRLLSGMATAGHTANTGMLMLDTARDICDILFPETTGDEDDAPMPGDPQHGEAGEAGEGEQDEAEQNEAEAESPEDSKPEGKAAPGDQDDESDEAEPGEDGSQEGQSSDESAEQDSDGGESQSEDDEPGEPGSEDDSQTEEQVTDTEVTEAEPSESDQAVAAALAAMEDKADGEVLKDGDDQAKQPPPPPTDQPKPSTGSGQSDNGKQNKGEWRSPTKEEREVGKGAERFLRELIEPSESSHINLSESPSSNIDPAALAVWKAGGQRTDPLFFRRTRRTVMPSPPVKIAVLVDVSMSMSVLQKPSALLSWALSNAALDLRNFAGRGVQIQSTLIHWGTTAKVIVPNGGTMPGLREYQCRQYTSAMPAALGLVDQQIPGFFETPAQPEHRLLVHFTDWYLGGGWPTTVSLTGKALAAGVNMLSVVPEGYSERKSSLPKVMGQIAADGVAQRGQSRVLKYNPAQPEAAWTEARSILSRG